MKKVVNSLFCGGGIKGWYNLRIKKGHKKFKNMNKKFLFLGLFLVGFFMVGLVSVHAQFVPGDRVRTITNVNVRSMPSPSGTVLGVQPMGSQGIIWGGPTSTYFYVNFDVNPDGYVSGTYLSKVSTSTICGDANGDGAVNISDVTYLISYIFSGGSAPSPLWVGDVNGSGAVNISDATYLISYIFSGGSAPVCNMGPVVTSFTGPSNLTPHESGAWRFLVNGVNSSSTSSSSFVGDFNYTLHSIPPDPGLFGLGFNGMYGMPVTYYGSLSSPGNYSVYLNISSNFPPYGTSTAVLPLIVSQSSSTEIIPPIIYITAPTSSAVVSGTVALSANAYDNVGVAGVQFKLDGVNLDSEDIYSPYSAIWNTTQAANSSHTLTAVARDVAGNIAVSQPVTVTVLNSQNQSPVILSAINGSSSWPSVVAIGSLNFWEVWVSSDDSFTYGFNWGDGTPSSTGSRSSGNFWLQPNHTYSNTGSYTVTFRATDSYGLSVTYSQTVVVLPNNNSPSIYQMPVTPSVPVIPASPLPIIPTAPKTMKGVPSVLGASTYDTLQSMRYQLDEMAKQLLNIMEQINR